MNDVAVETVRERVEDPPKLRVEPGPVAGVVVGDPGPELVAELGRRGVEVRTPGGIATAGPLARGGGDVHDREQGGIVAGFAGHGIGEPGGEPGRVEVGELRVVGAHPALLRTGAGPLAGLGQRPVVQILDRGNGLGVRPQRRAGQVGPGDREAATRVGVAVQRVPGLRAGVRVLGVGSEERSAL